MKSQSNSYWYYFFSLILLVASLDYIEHITRPNQHFASIKFNWFLYSLSRTIFTILVIIAVCFVLYKMVSKYRLIIDLFALAVGFGLYPYFLGPLAHKLFVSHLDLRFIWNWGSFLFILLFFLVLRGIHFFSIKYHVQIKKPLKLSLIALGACIYMFLLFKAMRL
jgi:hypothetical protein